MALPRLRAVALDAAPRDPTAVGPEVWYNLEEVVSRLGSERATALFGDADAQAILTRWKDKGLDAEAARKHAEALREAAFAEKEPGVVAVTMVAGNEEDAPGALLVLAGVLDFLATLAGEGRTLRFEDEEVLP